MPTVLITAFEPYDRWSSNSSWSALVELTRDLPSEPKLVTRRYPVDFIAAKERLYNDLNANYDFAIFLGQSPGSARIHLESIAINAGGMSHQLPDEFEPLVPGGPVAYQTSLPLTHWARQLREARIPAQVSYHAGTYLCNAVFYLAQHFITARKLKTKTVFVHLPLTPEQIIDERHDYPSLPAATVANALRTMLSQLVTDDAPNFA